MPIESTKNSKFSACGELTAPQDFFHGTRALAKGFYLTKCAPQAKKIQLERVTKGILPYKMSAAGEIF